MGQCQSPPSSGPAARDDEVRQEPEPDPRPTFFDMVHSNNAARIRLWIRLKEMTSQFQIRMVKYADLQSQEYVKVNPHKKVPALITETGMSLFESEVIMQYLEDRYGNEGPPLMPTDPEERAFVNLLVRIHDLYIASPNCTQPNFAHTQGCMYLAPYETAHCSAARAMDKPTRAAKLAEIWKQLSWLNEKIKAPFMTGDSITHADLTWFPTAVFMKFMLPRFFSWPDLFTETEHFPKLTAWFVKLLEKDEFQTVQGEIWGFWEQKEKDGQWESITAELKDPQYKWKYP